MAASPFRLSCMLSGHTSDVRSVTVTWDGKIVSASRDKTAKIWTPDSEGGYRETMTFREHQNFVSSVCTIPPNKTFPSGLIITGSNDKYIRLFSESSESSLHTLKGHSNTVCKLTAAQKENFLLSASWDKTAVLWNLKTFKAVVTFVGHESAIWSVIQLEGGAIVTASADKTINVWSEDGCCLRTLSGHTECVRDLAPVNAEEFLSCSNDISVRHWNSTTGDCLNVYYGHSNFIYSIGILGSGFVTSGEDRTVKIWVDGEVSESITIPASSIWSVATTPNGDVVAGSSDGVIRVFTSDISRQASAEKLKSYEEHLNPTEKDEYGKIRLSELPGPEALIEPGKGDNSTKVIRENNTAVAYAWCEAERKWNKVGTVIGCSEGEKDVTAGKSVFEGKEYDFVFSVDVEEGKPPLQLPYNINENPWEAAEKFIQRNQLCRDFLDEIANFIIKNSNSNGNQPSMSFNEYIDPFTGSARYVPQNDNVVTHDTPTNIRNASFQTSYTNSSIDTDRIRYFPQREFLRFDQGNLSIILEKLLEFNRRSGDGNQLVKDSEIEDLMKICKDGAECTPENIVILSQLLEWPEEILFPVLDVMRLAIRNTDVNRHLCTDNLIPTMMKFLSSERSTFPNNMLALRVLSNMLAADPGQMLAEKNKIVLINIIKGTSGPYNKTVQVAMATLLLNMTVVITRSKTSEGRIEALVATQEILPLLSDPEAIFRALVALGTLLENISDRGHFVTVFRTILTEYLNDPTLNKKIQDCSRDILQIL